MPDPDLTIDGGYDLDGTLADAVWIDDGGPE
jgi:hypothetical protein